MLQNGDWQILPIVTQMACYDSNIPGRDMYMYVYFFKLLLFTFLKHEVDIPFCVFKLGEFNLMINQM